MAYPCPHYGSLRPPPYLTTEWVSSWTCIVKGIHLQSALHGFNSIFFASWQVPWPTELVSRLMASPLAMPQTASCLMQYRTAEPGPASPQTRAAPQISSPRTRQSSVHQEMVPAKTNPSSSHRVSYKRRPPKTPKNPFLICTTLPVRQRQRLGQFSSVEPSVGTQTFTQASMPDSIQLVCKASGHDAILHCTTHALS